MPGVITDHSCIRCGKAIPRGQAFVDTSGKWWCRECFTSHGLRQSSPRPGSPGDGPIAIEGPNFAGKTRAPCPKCGAAMTPGIPACSVCAYDPASIPLDPAKARDILGDFDPDATPKEKGEPRTIKKPPKPRIPTCTNCGYSLKGLPAQPSGGIVCPECSTHNTVVLRRDEDEETSREIARWTYLKPLYLLIGGLIGYVLLLIARGWINGNLDASIYGIVRAPGQRGWNVALVNVLVGLAFYAWTVVVASTLTILAGLAWAGLSTTFRVLFLQSAGLLATIFAVWTLLYTIPLPLPWWAISAFCGLFYIYYLADMQEIEWWDATVIMLATGVVVGATLLVASRVF
ncbi:hypothetical protein PHYC_01222 [Phycisphaerales bacterium]|nr:hypothetical protein PHYC_01222 [Phycisphaerales bacterium]